MLENTEGAIKNGQSRDTLNVGHRTEEEVKQNKNTQHKMCWTPLLTNTNNINKTGALLQPTGGDDEPNIGFRRKS